MLCITKYFVLFFRNGLNYVIRFKNRKKKSPKFVWKRFFIAKSAKFKTKKDLEQN